MKKSLSVSITKKLIVYLSIASFIPLLLFGVGAVSQSRTILKNEMNKFTDTLLSEKQKNIELMMNNAESLISNIVALDEIKATLSNENTDVSSFTKHLAQEKMGGILSGYSNLKGLISIDVFSMDGAHYYVGDTLNAEQIRGDLKERLLNEALKSKDKIIWNGIEDNINKNSHYSKVITLSSMVKVLDKNTLKERPVGIILVNFDVAIFCDALNPYGFSDASYTLVDGKNRIICSAYRDRIGRTSDIDFIKRAKEKTVFYKEKIEDRLIFSTYSMFSKSDWVISGSIPSNVISQKTSTIGNNILELLVSCFLLSVMFAIVFSKKYLTPIKNITELFRKFKNGTLDLKVRLKTNLKDEIGELVIWFNTFLESLEAMKAAEEALEKELRSDFRRTVENLENIVFKLKLSDEGKSVFSLFEGKLAHKMFIDTNEVNGKEPEEVFKGESVESVNYYCEKAFKGEVASFEGSLMGRFFYITLSPIMENSQVFEVVGSAIDITELKEAEQTIRVMSYYDSLTLLPNRILFKERVSTAIAHARRSGNMLAIMFLDLDDFKLINDTLGHAMGDRLLQEVANQLKECIHEDDTVSRMGGDEFTFLFP